MSTDKLRVEMNKLTEYIHGLLLQMLR